MSNTASLLGDVLRALEAHVPTISPAKRERAAQALIRTMTDDQEPSLKLIIGGRMVDLFKAATIHH